MTRLCAFRERMPQEIGAALISSPQNQFYLSSFHFSDGYLLVLRDEAFLLTDPRYAEAARREASAEFTVVLSEKGMLSHVAELLAERGVNSLWLEEAHATLSLCDRLKELLVGVTVRGGASREISSLRAVKDEAEIDAIMRAQGITDRAFSHILSYLRPGVRELDVACELEYFMRKQGAQAPAFDTIAVSGSASSLPHGVPRDRVLERGFLTMDFGARFGGYCSDMTRTVVIGRADGEMKRLYRTVLTAQQAALDAAAAGYALSALDGVAREIIDGAGYRGCFGHSLGHGVGIDIHEAPRLSARTPVEEVLMPGHVVTVEPGIYLEGKYGCRIEDMIAVRADGSILNLTASTKELIEVL
ncbi:MAG: M24 family metallopeptidase [Ruminococcaceae bacterium]|nr:M24 family metallopeptidase [Oscillospiraceae bacterium]